MTTSEIVKEKREEIMRVAARYNVDGLRVFGSTARGDADADSDIDILVRPPAGFTLLLHAALVRELEALLGRKVDIVSERGLRARIREHVLREAVPL